MAASSGRRTAHLIRRLLRPRAVDMVQTSMFTKALLACLVFATAACGTRPRSPDALVIDSQDAWSRADSPLTDRLGHRDDRSRDTIDLSPDAHASPMWVLFGGGVAGDTFATATTLDPAGNSYLAANFSGSIQVGALPVTSTSQGCGLISKIDTTGNVVWAQPVSSGASGGSSLWAIALGNSGELYVAGKIVGQQNVGTTSLTGAAGDWLVAMIDSGGTIKWARSYGGPLEDAALGIAVLPSGDLVVTGQIQGVAGFGSTALTAKGGADVGVARLSSSGDVLWATSGGGKEDDLPVDVAVDGASNTYVTAIASDGLFGSIPVTSTNTALVTRLDSAGKFTWVAQAVGTKIRPAGGAVDAAGNAYMAGHFQDVATFGSMTLNAPAPTKLFSYVAKIGPTGSFLWATTGGAANVRDVAVDIGGNVYITGFITGKTTFGSTIVAAAGWSDILLAKIDGTGTWLGALSAGGKLMSYGQAVAASTSGAVRVAGAVLFDPLHPFVPVADTLTFGSQVVNLDGRQQLFLWGVPL